MGKVYGNLTGLLFSGKLGNMIGFIRNGKQYVRSMPKKSCKEPTPKQIAQRERFRFASNFIRSIQPIIQMGFNPPRGSKYTSSYSMAMAYLLRDAVTGEFPNFTIDFKNLELSPGKSARLMDETVNKDEENIEFKWEYLEKNGYPLKHYKITLIAITEDHQLFYSDVNPVQENQKGLLSIPNIKPHTNVNCYIATTDMKDRQHFCGCSYLGVVKR